jgi:hypothetical protein
MPTRRKPAPPPAPPRTAVDGSPFGEDGYDASGHDRNGFNRVGLHRDTNDRFNPDGYDRDGRRKGLSNA